MTAINQRKSTNYTIAMKALLFAAALVFSGAAYAQQAPTFKVATDKDIYLPGDSVHWQCELNGFGSRYNTITLQLWIENIRTGAKWQFRFPVINGYSEGAMHIGSDIPAGRYAFNFLLQPDFFNVAGTLSRPRAKDTALNYLVLFKDKETLVKSVKVAPDGQFIIRGLVFQDTAMFSFSRVGRNAEVPVIRVKTSLDSTFKPIVPAVTKFVNISAGDVKDTNMSADIQQSKTYQFDMNSPQGHQLAEVVVKEKRSNKLIKDYQDEFVTAQFKTADDITLDGLSNDDMEKAGDIYSYLMMHVPGLTASMNNETGVQEVKWRNASPAIYVDEYHLPDDMPITVMPGEIALIKVYRPGSGPLTGANSNSGAIAIYTKVGPYSRFLPSTEQRNRFYLHGYDGISIDWSNN